MFENLFVKQLNADAQESASADAADATTATTNPPEEPQNGNPDETAHDDFDWSIDKRNVTVYNAD